MKQNMEKAELKITDGISTHMRLHQALTMAHDCDIKINLFLFSFPVL